MSRLIHVTLFALKAGFFWEWVPSKANWSDEISRDGLQATWHKRHGFTTHFAVFPLRDLVSTTSRASTGCGVSLSALG